MATWSRTRPGAAEHPALGRQAWPATSWWLGACLLVAGLTALRLWFLWRSGLELDFEEAQYWLWAQEPAWGYWSKPPMIAWLIAAGTAVCGDTAPCIRSAAPVLHGATALVVGAIGRTIGGPGLGAWSALTYATLPGVGLSSILMTTDVPLVFCWAVALLALVRLLDAPRWPWAALCGVALGAGLLSKYTMALFPACALIGLARSHRRVQVGHAVLATGLAAALVAPNLAWNLGHELGTVRHTLERAAPGGSSFRLGEPIGFVLAQLFIFGPVLCWALVAWARGRLPPGSGHDRLLASCTVLPLAAAVAVSVAARGNANWGAPAYVAGTILVVSALLAGGRAALARASAVLNAGVGLAVYLALAGLPAFPVPGAEPIAVGARFTGWETLGRRTAAEAAALGDARILADLRELLAVAGYYGRVPEHRLVEWNPSGMPHSHFQLRTRLEAGDPGPFVFVSYRPRPVGVTRQFAHTELVGTVTVPLAHGLDRTHWLFVLRDFLGYPPPDACADRAPAPTSCDLDPASRSASFTPPIAAARMLWPGNTESPTRWSPGTAGADSIDQ